MVRKEQMHFSIVLRFYISYLILIKYEHDNQLAVDGPTFIFTIAVDVSNSTDIKTNLKDVPLPQQSLFEVVNQFSERWQLSFSKVE